MEKNINPQENILLANHTTFRIGGPARYFLIAENKEELIGAIGWAKEKKLPFYLLGGGSNVLVGDAGYEGLVIKMQNCGLKIDKKDNECIIKSESGVSFNKIILETAKNGFSGAEWGLGIPGTIGGAIYGNAGRLGQDISPIVQSVTILNKNLEEEVLAYKDCDFNYRESRFKKTGEIILSATLRFVKKDQGEIDKILIEAKQVIKDSPPWPSAGCIFKNYKLTENDELLKNHLELKARVRGNKIGVGFLIDQCGLKGKQIGGAKIWEGHANYIVNVSGATASDVENLIEQVKKSVKEKYGVELEEEIRRLK